MFILQFLSYIFERSAVTRFACVVLCLSSGPLVAAPLSWGSSGTGGTGTWDANATANWFNGTGAVKWPTPAGIDDDAVFSGSPGTVSLAAGGITANDLTFNTSGFTVQGQTLTLNGSTPTLTTEAGVSAEISSTLAGSAGLTKTGAGSTGVLTLSGSNTFSGGVAINSGFLRLTHSNALGTTAKTLNLNGGSGIAAGLGLSLDPGAGGAVILPAAISIAMASNSYAGIRNKSGTNEIKGAISLKSGLSSSTISSESGSLTISGTVTATASGRVLYLTGNSTAENIITGVISNGSGLSVAKNDAGSWKLKATNTYSGATTISTGKLTGVVGGSCASSAVTLAASIGNSATLGVSITDKTKRWYCASLTVNNGGIASDLEFDFGTITPSTTLAPLNITGAADFTSKPNINIIADSNLGPIGTKFPLITWGSTTGTPPSTFTLATSNPTTAHLELTGNTLYLVIDDYTPTLSDAQLFSALNLDYPGLESVKSLVTAGNIPAGKSALATYLRTRTNVNWTFDWRNPTTNISFDQAAADTQIAGTFSFAGYTQTFPNGDVDWLYSPTPTAQWVSLINRMNFWPNFGNTYWGTGNESYTLAWARQLRSWITLCPLPTGTQSILAPWATIQAAERMRTWPDTFLRFILSPSLTDENVVLYLKSSIENTRYLRENSISGAMNFNIDAWELNGIYTTATLFPELNEAAEWRSYAVAQMNTQKQLQFYPDGVHIELSPRYHIGTLEFIKGIYELASLNNRLADLPAGYITSTEKAYEFVLYHSAPSRLLPPFNDCGSANEDSRTYLQDAYTLFPNRTDFLWTSGGGTKPAKTSWNFPYAGYADMRSSWETNANFLCFDAGPLGSSSHRHEDKLNIVLWAYGREMLFDSGGGSYESSIWRTWGTSSYSHNCITVDGLDQEGGDGSYAATDADYQSQAPINMRWESGALHDFAAGTYNRGYGGNYNNRPAAQTRRVLFVKPDIYLVADTMVPSNTASHTYQARWHLLSTNTTLDPLTKTVTTNDAGQTNLAVVPCLGSGLTVDNVSARLSNSGSTTPVLSEMLGWDQPNLSAGTQTPATTVTQTLSGTGTKQFLTLFLPLKSGQTYPVVSIVSTGTTSAEVILTDGRKLQVYADPDPTRGLKLTEILPGNIPARYVGAGYTPPVIAGLANQNVGPGAIINQPFTVTDNSPIANVTVTVRSLNQALVTDANLTLGGSGNNRTVTANLTPNTTGIATLIVTALDPDGSITSETIEITAAYPQDSPPIALAGISATLPNTQLDIDLGTLVSDAETPDSSLLFKVSNPVNGTVTLLPDGRTARFTPANNLTGAANFQYTATDLGNDPRIYAHYGIAAPDDIATALIQDTSLNNRPADISTFGTGSAQLVTDAPSALAAFDTQSIQLTENGDYNAARLQRTISSTDLNLNDQSWTFACWFKRTATTNDDFIFHLGSGNGYGSDEELQLWCQAGNSKIGLAHWNGIAVDMNITSGSVAPAGQWHNIALTYTRVSANRGNLALYINGSPAGSAANIPFNFNQANPVNIGGHAQSTSAVSRWFNGSIDEAVIVEAALTAQEISLLATQPVARLGGTTVTNTVSVTVGSPIQQWRQTYFGTTANSGNTADTFDANNDGETNLLEFATGQNPHAATLALIDISKTASNLEFTYTRNRDAFNEGYVFEVQHNMTLTNPWTSAGPGILTADGPLQALRATIPNAGAAQRFARLKVTTP
jgi:autotransporter-associated beta strand protein